MTVLAEHIVEEAGLLQRNLGFWIGHRIYNDLLGDNRNFTGLSINFNLDVFGLAESFFCSRLKRRLDRANDPGLIDPFLTTDFINDCDQLSVHIVHLMINTTPACLLLRKLDLPTGQGDLVKPNPNGFSSFFLLNCECHGTVFNLYDCSDEPPLILDWLT